MRYVVHDESKESIAFAKQLKVSMKDYTPFGGNQVSSPLWKRPSPSKGNFSIEHLVLQICPLKAGCQARSVLLVLHVPRPNVRTAVCNEKVPGKEDMQLG